MKKQLLCFASTLLFLCHAGISQVTIFSDTFAYDITGPKGWTIVSLNSSGPGASNNALWEMTPDGTADGGAYWEGRPAIQSKTATTGAILFNSDSLDNGGTVNNSCGTGAVACAPHEGVIISPKIDASTIASVGVKFHQYYRGHASRTYLEVSTDSISWTTFEINKDINDRPFGGETAEADSQLINISSVAGGQAAVWIRFRFEGDYYFWIIDDVEVMGVFPADLALTQVVWPDKDLPCLLGEEEQVQVKVQNYGDSAQTNFSVDLILNDTVFFSQTVTETLSPNQCLIVTFDTLLDLTGGYRFDVGVNTNRDQNFNNNWKFCADECCLVQDTVGGTYVCNQMIVQFTSTTTQKEKDSIRMAYNAHVERFCSCDTIELWEVDSFPINLPTDTIKSQFREEHKQSLAKSPKVVKADLNYVTRIRRPAQTARMGGFPTNGNGTITDTLVVAVMDTGLDFFHDSLSTSFWRNEAELVDRYGTDNDSNCVLQDNWGANLIQPARVPLDDESHGTHVSGLVLRELPPCLRLEVLPIKILAQNGGGTLFEMICGTHYALEKDVDLINMSLGYPAAHASSFLDSIFNQLKLKDIMVITAAGNDTSNNDTIAFWPAHFNQEHTNVLSVTALDSMNQLARFANWGKTSVDIGAPGVGILGPVPGGEWETKSGTSMAAPYVTRAAALCRATHKTDPYTVIRDILFQQALRFPSLTDSVINGKSLNLVDQHPCQVGVDPLEDRLTPLIHTFPNPFDQEVNISFMLPRPHEVSIDIYNAFGQLIHRHQQPYPVGAHAFVWKAPTLPAGLYLYQFVLEGQLVESGKWIKSR